jgi:hypothetical protein
MIITLQQLSVLKTIKLGRNVYEAEHPKGGISVDPWVDELTIKFNHETFTFTVINSKESDDERL